MDTSNSAAKTIALELSERYGEVIGGKMLWHMLGYKTLAAFKQAIARDSLSLPTFFIEGRKGRHALTSDVAAWLVECRANAGKPSSNKVPEAFKRARLK